MSRKETSDVLVDGFVFLCNDPSPEVGLWKKIKQYLIPPHERFAKIAIFGGAISLAHKKNLPTEHDFLMSQIYFAKSTFPGARKIMIVGHDCRFYRMIPNKKFTIGDKKRDMIKAADLLRSHFPDFTITVFFALKRGDFEKLQ